ncbi:hypothetical protein HF263_03925 [Rhizobium leguminosarum]|uniref:hypothetical protein n=1 Tax=Rhizobium leguminosarum TaxID=384 RepID=UPI001C911298|nr:hypothetical protein [Rhizobium leguminosarum]MBY2993769.1 hypothetical protein [Rhizobium leguminosarum]MBY3055219.1 hypothetical protein [Rhizobium leguminosarum]
MQFSLEEPDRLALSRTDSPCKLRLFAVFFLCLRGKALGDLMFEAIPYIGSGLALVAFIVAASFYAYRETLKTQRQNVKSAAPSDVDDVIATANEYVKVDLGQLPEADRKAVVLRQLDIKAARESRKAWSFLICALLIACLSAFAIFTYKPDGSTGRQDAPLASPANTGSASSETTNEPSAQGDIAPATTAPDQAEAPAEPHPQYDLQPEEQVALEPETEPLPDPEPIGWIYLGTVNSDNTWNQPRSDSLSGQAAEDVVGTSLVLNQTVNVRDGPFLSRYKSNGGCSNTPSNQIGRALAAASTVKIVQVQRVLPCWPEFVWAQVAVE